MKLFSKSDLDNFFEPLIEDNWKCIIKYNKIKYIRKLVVILCLTMLGVILFYPVIQSPKLFVIALNIDFLFLIPILLIIQLILVLFRNLYVVEYYRFWLNYSQNLPNGNRVVVTNITFLNDIIIFDLKYMNGSILKKEIELDDVIYVPEIGESLFLINGYFFNNAGVPVTNQSLDFITEYFKEEDVQLFGDSKFGVGGFAKFYFTNKALIRDAHGYNLPLKNKHVIWVKFSDFDPESARPHGGVIYMWWLYPPNKPLDLKGVNLWIKNIKGKPLEFFNNNLIGNCIDNLPFIGNWRSIFPESATFGPFFAKFGTPCKMRVYGYLYGVKQSKLRRWFKCH